MTAPTAMPACLASAPDGTRLAVRAQPGARRVGVVGLLGTRLKVAVQAPACDGRANDALAELLRTVFDPPAGRPRLLQGAAQRDKLWLLPGLTVAAAYERLRTVCPAAAR